MCIHDSHHRSPMRKGVAGDIARLGSADPSAGVGFTGSLQPPPHRNERADTFKAAWR